MRIELFYKPGCKSYKKALGILETVIAEERLPIHVELTETTDSHGSHEPRIKLDGETVSESAHSCMEELRSQISMKWHDLTSKMLRQH
jgi:hypothetical protein